MADAVPAQRPSNKIGDSIVLQADSRRRVDTAGLKRREQLLNLLQTAKILSAPVTSLAGHAAGARHSQPDLRAYAQLSQVFIRYLDKR